MSREAVKFSLKVIGNLCLMLLHWVKGIAMFFVPEKILHKDVKDDIVLITGGGSGIGRLMAITFAKLGAIVVTWDVNKVGNEETRRLVTENGGVAYAYSCDVSDRESVYATAKQVKHEVGVVSILINNAGIVSGKKFFEIADEKIVKTMEVNAFSQYWTIKAFLPDMLSIKRGHLVFISSAAGISGACQMTEYCGSKYAVVGLWDSLSLELRSAGSDFIKTTVVCPYMINTGLFDGFYSRLLPMLDTGYAVDKIVSGVLANKKMIILPWFMTYLYMLKWVMPVESSYALFDAVGGNDYMNNFVGRVSKEE